MVDIPVESVFVVLFWSQEQCENLQCCENEKSNSNVAMTSKLHATGFTSQFHASSPTGNPKNIGRDLAGNMEIKPCRIRRREGPQVSRYHNTKWK
uniref:Auxin-responsive family protein n=1 Tax=Rhizophora mucronata TaxID=61149 RepID=A0A2P2NKK3_RHIMU